MHTLLMGMWSGIATLENSLAVSHKINHAETIWPSNRILGHLCQRNENLCSFITPQNIIYSTLQTGNNMSFSGWINCCTSIPWIIYPKKGQTIDTHNNLDALSGNYAEWRVGEASKRLHTIWFHWNSILEIIEMGTD